MSEKNAVVLPNFGGPDTLQSVRPFLFNLFYDVFRLPFPLRWVCAQAAAFMRASKVREKYKIMGGGSPLYEETRLQAEALEHHLNQQTSGSSSFKVFVAMQYWHPFFSEVIDALAQYSPTRVILLPLYPHFSSKTTLSAFKNWEKWCYKKGFRVLTDRICCYPALPGLVDAYKELIEQAWNKLDPKKTDRVRFLFSAHSLPMHVIRKGDPYPQQVAITVSHLSQKLGLSPTQVRICYQSRVGPIEWLGPSTESEIQRAGQEQVSVVLIPISFVSEHIETLVELDREYTCLSQEVGVPSIIRVPTVRTHPLFIEGLKALVNQKINGSGSTHTCLNWREEK